MSTQTGIYDPNRVRPAVLDPLIPMRKVIELTSLCRSTIYEQINDGTFPKPIKLSSRRIGWRLSVINSWIATKEK